VVPFVKKEKGSRSSPITQGTRPATLPKAGKEPGPSGRRKRKCSFNFKGKKDGTGQGLAGHLGRKRREISEKKKKKKNRPYPQGWDFIPKSVFAGGARASGGGGGTAEVGPGEKRRRGGSRGKNLNRKPFVSYLQPEKRWVHIGRGET